jgi:hypothetical protein
MPCSLEAMRAMSQEDVFPAMQGIVLECEVLGVVLSRVGSGGI